jgi:hypothetical protein
MKTLSIVLVIFLMLPITAGLSSSGPKVKSLPIVEVPSYRVLETLTIYHPVTNQCDADPLITANNSRIDLDKLSRNEIRWMALSRDLLKRWNGEFNYGDTVILHAGDPDIDGLWVVNDSMNKRFKDRGDLLFHHDKRTTGIWKNVKIIRWEGKPVII